MMIAFLYKICIDTPGLNLENDDKEDTVFQERSADVSVFFVTLLSLSNTLL